MAIDLNAFEESITWYVHANLAHGRVPLGRKAIAYITQAPHCLSSAEHFLFLFLLLIFQAEVMCPMPYLLTVPSILEALGVFILNILLLVKPASV